MRTVYATHVPSETGPIPYGQIHLAHTFTHVTLCGMIVTGNASTGSKAPYGKYCRACRKAELAREAVRTAELDAFEAARCQARKGTL